MSYITTVTIKASTYEKLEEMHQKTQTALKSYRKTDFGNGWLGNMLHYIGLDESEYNNLDSGYDVAGKVTFIGPLEKETNSFVIKIDSVYSSPIKVINDFYKGDGIDLKFDSKETLTQMTEREFKKCTLIRMFNSIDFGRTNASYREVQYRFYKKNKIIRGVGRYVSGNWVWNYSFVSEIPERMNNMARYDFDEKSNSLFRNIKSPKKDK